MCGGLYKGGEIGREGEGRRGGGSSDGDINTIISAAKTCLRLPGLVFVGAQISSRAGRDGMLHIF